MARTARHRVPGFENPEAILARETRRNRPTRVNSRRTSAAHGDPYIHLSEAARDIQAFIRGHQARAGIGRAGAREIRRTMDAHDNPIVNRLAARHYRQRQARQRRIERGRQET